MPGEKISGRKKKRRRRRKREEEEEKREEGRGHHQYIRYYYYYYYYYFHHHHHHHPSSLSSPSSSSSSLPQGSKGVTGHIEIGIMDISIEKQPDGITKKDLTSDLNRKEEEEGEQRGMAVVKGVLWGASY